MSLRSLSICLLIVFTSLTLPLSAQRLPKAVVPEHYDLRFVPDMAKDTFEGEETIDVKITQPTSEITLNAIELQLHEVKITSGGESQTASVEANERDEMVTLKVPKSLAAGAAQIHINFSGILNKQLRGFYSSEVDGKKIAVTQFESTDARRAFPCFDEPAMKATFDVTIVAPANNMAISNGKVISDTPGPEAGQHTVKFATTPKLSTYLVAMVVGDFACVSGESDGIPIRVCAPPPGEKMGDFALSIAKFDIHYYNSYFGVPYPYGKLDLIAIPDFSAGAMENAGAITFRTAVLIIDPKASTERAKKNVAIDVTHEIAHQWFGDLVTMQWWDDVWLNEGFATWMEAKSLAAWRPEWKMELFGVYSNGNVMGQDSAVATRPIHASAANTPDEIAQLFDGISYEKASAVLRMVETYVGEEPFRQGVRNYIKAHAYGNATAADFWNAITQATGKPIDKVMEPLVMQPGVPMVSVSAACDAGKTKVSLSQRRYYGNSALMEKPSSELWDIPVCFSLPGSKRECHLLAKEKDEITLNGCQPLIFANSGGTGYYRTAYDSKLFSNLQKNAEQALSPAERLSLLNDEWAMVSADRAGIDDSLRLAGEMRNDHTLYVWAKIQDALTEIDNQMLEPADKEGFQGWVRDLATPLAHELGWRPKSGEEESDTSLRPLVYSVLGLIGHDDATLAEGESAARKYLEGSADADDASMVDVVLKLGAAHGDKQLYDLYLTSLPKQKNAQSYRSVLDALTYFPQPELVQRTLEYSLSDQVRAQDTPLVLGFWKDAHPTPEVWNFIRGNWPEVSKKVTKGYYSFVQTTPASFLCSETDRKQAEEFFHEHHVEGADLQERQALESIEDCATIKQQQSGRLAKFFDQPLSGHAGAR